MDANLLSFISKLPTTTPRMEHFGRKVDDAIDQITRRLPDLPEDKQRSLGIFMQHMDIPSFTDVELRAAATRRLDLLISNTNETLPIYFTEEQNLFDTGSYHIHKVLRGLGLTKHQIDYMMSRKSRRPSYIRRVMGDY